MIDHPHEQVKVLVDEHGTEHTYEGSARTVAHELTERYPFLTSSSIEDLVEEMNEHQALSAEIVTEPAAGFHEHDGFREHHHPAFSAAYFLSQAPEKAHPLVARQALRDRSDYFSAALHTYGLPTDQRSKDALRAIMALTAEEAAPKSEPVPAPKTIEPASADGRGVAERVRKAFSARKVEWAQLRGGKHARKFILAGSVDATGDRYIIKPPAGVGPVATASRNNNSSSSRDVAFAKVAQLWGIAEVPKVWPMLFDGTLVAVGEFVPEKWQMVRDLIQTDVTVAQRTLAKYRDSGELHKWAVLDYVCGNPDRHAGNILLASDIESVRLIDHGSAFVGYDFDPPHDELTFVPYYLRAWAVPGFDGLDRKAKLAQMPRCPRDLCPELVEWVGRLTEEDLVAACRPVGIDPAPSIARLKVVKDGVGQGSPDVAVNSLWV